MTEARKRETVSLRDLRRMGVLQPHHMERLVGVFVEDAETERRKSVRFNRMDTRYPLTRNPLGGGSLDWANMEASDDTGPHIGCRYVLSVGDLSRAMHALNWRRWCRVIGAALHEARTTAFDQERPPPGLDEGIRTLRQEFLSDTPSAPHRTMAGDWFFAGFRRTSPEMAVMVAAHAALKAAHPGGDADAPQVAEQIDLVIDARSAIVSAWREEVNRAEEQETRNTRPEREPQE